MTKDQIEIGATYSAKVSDKVVPVRIDRVHPRAGWLATNLATNRQVHIKSAQRLRGRKQMLTLPMGYDLTRPISLIDVAAHVLKDATEPMGCKDIVARVVEQGLWSSPNGKTPDATLYSAIIREIKVKGDDARFAKAGPGKFAARAA